MKIGLIASVLFWVGVIAMTTLSTGCSGMEIGGKLGVYAVDERSEIQRTQSKSMPLKCRFVSCDNNGGTSNGK